MAVISTPIKSVPQVLLDNGTTTTGQQKTKTMSFPHPATNLTATTNGEAIVAVAGALSPCLSSSIVSIRLVSTTGLELD